MAVQVFCDIGAAAVEGAIGYFRSLILAGNHLAEYSAQYSIPPGNRPTERAQVLQQAPQLSLHAKSCPTSIQSDHLVDPIKLSYIGLIHSLEKYVTFPL